MSGGEYFVDLVKERDGLWKIKKWTMKVIWSQGDRSIIQRPR
jgi:molybdopterin synthase catalytic subunit